MTKVDTMSKEKRCDWCFTSAQSKQAKTMGRDTSRRDNISLTYVHCCANLYKTVSRTLSIIWSISCYLAMLPKLEFESPPWQEHVCECVEVSIWVQAIPNDWVGDTLEHTWPSPDHHIWAANGGLFPFSNYLARLLRSIDRCYWGDKETQLKIQVLKFNIH